MSYNIHEGKGADGVVDLIRIAGVINAVDPDIVVLQEVDKNTEDSGYVDQAAVLASLTFMGHEFGKTIDWDRGELGNAILTKHPYTLIGNYLLPKAKRNEEQRAALALAVDLSAVYEGTALVTVVGTHLDHRKQAPRILAVSAIEAILADQPPDRPALLVGDLNDISGSPTLNAFDLYWEIEDLGLGWYTYPAESPDRQLDYVLHRAPGDWTVQDIEVVADTVASDHRPIAYTYELNTLPTARFTAVCTGLTCDFTDTSYDSNGAVGGWAWDFSDSATTTVQHPTHPFIVDGTYTVSLTVTDNELNTHTTSQELTVSTGPAPDIELSTSGYKLKGLMKTDLAWMDATSATVRVFRDSVLIATTPNDGLYTDPVDQRGSVSFTYQVCEGSASVCSNESVVTF